MSERLWMMGSALLLVLAAFFVWRNNLSAAFVTAALGACAWFISYRSELRKLTKDDKSNSEVVAEDEDNDEDDD